MSDVEITRVYDLVSLYLDASLTSAQEAELATLLEQSGNAAEFLEFTRIDREIAGLFAGPVSDQQMSRLVLREIHQRKENGSTGTSAIMQHVRVKRAKNVRTRSSAGAWLWALPAAAALIAVILLLRNSGTTAVPIATLANATDAMLVRDGKNVTAISGAPLFANDVLNTNSAGAASLRYADGTQLDLSADSAATLDVEVNSIGKRVLLERGSLTASVTPQPQGHPLVIRTAIAEAIVVGTKFTLNARADASRLDVLEGKVKFTRRSDAASVDVTAGNFAVAKAGVTLAVAPIQPAQPDSPVVVFDAPEPLPAGAQVLYQAQFNARPDAEWVGTWEKPPVNGLRDVALKAHPLNELNHGSRFFCDLRTPKMAAGFRVGAHTYLRFRVLPVNFGARQVIKLMFKRGDEMNYSGYILNPVPNRWQSFTVRLDDKIFFSDDFKKKLQPGETINWLIWEGLSKQDSVPKDATLWLEDPVVFDAAGEVPAISLQDDADRN